MATTLSEELARQKGRQAQEPGAPVPEVSELAGAGPADLFAFVVRHLVQVGEAVVTTEGLGELVGWSARGRPLVVLHTGEEPRECDPLHVLPARSWPTDPTPLRRQDSLLWTRLLGSTAPEIRAVLYYVRWFGCRLERRASGYVIRPEVGWPRWSSEKDYEQVRSLWLVPRREEIKKALGELSHQD